MKITVIISVLLITQVSASFYDMVQGAMDSSFGKIMTDVAIDVKDSMSCTVLAMKHALSISENATASYNEQCKAETDKNTVSDTKTEGTAGKVQLIIEFMDQGKVNEENKGEFDAKVIEAVAKLMQQYNNQDKLASVEAAMAKETKMLESINDLLKEELKLMPKQDLNNTLHNYTKPSVDSILDKIKLLEDYECNTKNSSEATKIHKIIGEVLDKLNSISSNEAVENLKLDEILSDLEKQSNNSLPDLKQTFENWKDEKAKHLNKVQIEIEKHESLNNNTKPTNTTKLIPIVDHNEIDMSSTVPSAVLSQPVNVTKSAKESATMVVVDEHTVPMRKNNSDYDNTNSTLPISVTNNASKESKNSESPSEQTLTKITISPQNMSTTTVTILNRDSYSFNSSSTPVIVTESTTVSSTVVASDKITVPLHKDNSNNNIVNSTTPISLLNNTSTDSNITKSTTTEVTSEMPTSAQNITSTRSPSTVLNKDSYNFTKSSTPVIVTESTTVSSTVVASDKLTVPMHKDNSNNNIVNSTTPISLINNTSTDSNITKPTTEVTSEMTTSAQNITSTTSPSTVLNNDSYNLTRSSSPVIVSESTTVSSMVVPSDKLTGPMHKNNSNHNIDNSTTAIPLVNNTPTESTNSEPTMFEQTSEMTTGVQHITSTTSPSTVLNTDSKTFTRSITPGIVTESTTVSSMVFDSDKLTVPMHKSNSNYDIINSTTPISLINITSTESTNSKATTSEHTSEMTTSAQNITSISSSTVLNNDSYNLTRSSTPVIVTESTTVSSTVVTSEKLTVPMQEDNSNHDIINSTTPMSLINNTSTESTNPKPTMFEQTSEMTSAQNIISTTSPSTVLNTDSYTFTRSSTPGIVTESTTVSSKVVASDKLTGPMHKNNSNYDIINSTTPISLTNNTSTERLKTSDDMITSAQNITSTTSPSTTSPSTVLNTVSDNFTRSSMPGIVTESTTVSSTVTASYEHIVPIHKDNSNLDVINSTTHISLINMTLTERENSESATSATTSDEISTSAQNMTSTTGPSTVLNTDNDNFNKSSTPVLLTESTTKYSTVVASDEHTEPMHKVNSNYYIMNSTTPISVINNTLTDNESYKVDVTTSIPFSKTTGLQDNTTNLSVLSPLSTTRVNMNHNNNSDYSDDNINNTSNIINLLDILSRSTLAPTKHVTTTPSPLNYVDINGENTKKTSLLANTSLNPGSVINKSLSGNHSEITASPFSPIETTTIYYSENNGNSFNESITMPSTSTKENVTVSTDVNDIEQSTDVSMTTSFDQPTSTQIRINSLNVNGYRSEKEPLISLISTANFAEPVTIIPEPVTAVQVTGREEANSELTKMTSDDGGNIILDTTTVKISQFTDVFSSPNFVKNMIDTKVAADQLTPNILTNIDSNKSNMFTATSVSVTETTNSADAEPLYEYTTSVFNNLISSTNTNSKKPTNTDFDVGNDLTSVIEDTETSSSVSNHFRLSTATNYPSSQAFVIPGKLNDIATTENNQEQILPQSGEENNKILWPLDQTKSLVAENKLRTQVKKPAQALNTFEASLKKMFNVPSPKPTKKPISEIENFMNSFLSNIDIPLKTKPHISSKDITTPKAVRLFKSLEAHPSINSIDFNSLSDEPSTRRDTRAATHSLLKQSAHQREIEEARKLIQESNRQRHVIDSIEEKGTDARSVFGHSR